MLETRPHARPGSWGSGDGEGPQVGAAPTGEEEETPAWQERRSRRDSAQRGWARSSSQHEDSSPCGEAKDTHSRTLDNSS